MKSSRKPGFRNVDELLDVLPDDQLRIVTALRKLIRDCIPDVKERLAYGAPFYYRHSRILFIWPGALPWGNLPKKGVDLGFCRGHLLADPFPLEKGDRKEVFIKTFYSIKEIDADRLRTLLYEAVEIDSLSAGKKMWSTV